MPMIARPTTAMITWPPGHSMTFAVVESVPPPPDEPEPVAARIALMPITA